MRRVLTIAAVLTFVFASCGGNTVSKEDPDNPYEWGGGKDENGGSGSEGKTYYPKPEGSFRIVTYNVGAFCKYISVMNQNIGLVAGIIKEVEADAVGLNELDSVNARHNADQLALLAKELGGWQWHFGKGIDYRGGSYGNGVVVPKGVVVVDRYTVPLPNTTGFESRSIAVLETDRYVLAASHLDHSSEEYIQSQIAAVNSWAQSRYLDYAKPVFFLGDMNAVPSSDALKSLKACWDVISSQENTAGGTAPATKCIDYVFHYRKSAPVKVLGSHTISRTYCGDVSKASDHLPVYVDVTF